MDFLSKLQLCLEKKTWKLDWKKEEEKIVNIYLFILIDRWIIPIDF